MFSFDVEDGGRRKGRKRGWRLLHSEHSIAFPLSFSFLIAFSFLLLLSEHNIMGTIVESIYDLFTSFRFLWKILECDLLYLILSSSMSNFQRLTSYVRANFPNLLQPHLTMTTENSIQKRMLKSGLPSVLICTSIVFISLRTVVFEDGFFPVS